MDDDFDALAYHQERLRLLVWGGFFNAADLVMEIKDLEYDPEAKPHLEPLRSYAEAQLQDKKVAETQWPNVTDWDRLDAVFEKLSAAGILALHNAGYTTSDAHGDAWEVIAEGPEDWRGFVYYHGQDVERVLDGHPLFLGFDAVAQDPEAKRELGAEILDSLRGAGFAVDWEGDPEIRPSISGLNWRKRTDWGAPENAEPPAQPFAPTAIKKGGLLSRLTHHFFGKHQ